MEIALNYLKTKIKIPEEDWKNLTELNLGNYFIDILGGNNIGVNGMKYLADAANNWKNLTELNLSNYFIDILGNNNIGDDGKIILSQIHCQIKYF